jgi:hypothetical protein
VLLGAGKRALIRSLGAIACSTGLGERLSMQASAVFWDPPVAFDKLKRRPNMVIRFGPVSIEKTRHHSTSFSPSDFHEISHSND